MSHYIYFKRGDLPVVVQSVETGVITRSKGVRIEGPSEIIQDEDNPDVDVSVYCITNAPISYFMPK